MPRAAAALTTLEASQRLFRSWDPHGKLTARNAYLSGALSGVSEAVAFNPFQVVKVTLRTHDMAITSVHMTHPFLFWYQHDYMSHSFDMILLSR